MAWTRNSKWDRGWDPMTHHNLATLRLLLTALLRGLPDVERVETAAEREARREREAKEWEGKGGLLYVGMGPRWRPPEDSLFVGFHDGSEFALVLHRMAKPYQDDETDEQGE